MDCCRGEQKMTKNDIYSSERWQGQKLCQMMRINVLNVKMEMTAILSGANPTTAMNLGGPKMTFIQVNDGKAKSCAKSRVLMY